MACRLDNVCSMGNSGWLWYWKDDYTWRKYENSEELERLYVSGETTMTFTAGIHQYELSFSDMQQTNLSTYRTRRMTRRPVIRKNSEKDNNYTPPYWDPNLLPPAGYESINLEKSSPEYSKVLSLFNKTMSGWNVTCIDRIQNLQMWKFFKLQRDNMKTKAGKAVDERLLFHGTDTQYVDAICRDNIDWRLCGRHGTMYGEGSYFARDATYSNCYTSYGGTKSMFVCRVLVGDYTTGKGNYKKPPFKDEQNTVAFDSCVDVTHDPSLFVIFEKSQIYPEYLIQYEDPTDIYTDTLTSSTSGLLNLNPPLPTSQNKQTAAVASGSSALLGQPNQYPPKSQFTANAPSPSSSAVPARGGGAPPPVPPHQYPQKSQFTVNAPPPSSSSAVPAKGGGAPPPVPPLVSQSPSSLPPTGSSSTVQLPSRKSQRGDRLRSADVPDSSPLLSQSPAHARRGGAPPPVPTLWSQSPSRPQLIRTNPSHQSSSALPPPPPSTPVPHKKAKRKRVPLPGQPERRTRAATLPQTPTAPPPPVPSRRNRTSACLLWPPQIPPSVPPSPLHRLASTYPPPFSYSSLPRPSPSVQRTQTKGANRPPAPPPKPWLNNARPLPTYPPPSSSSSSSSSSLPRPSPSLQRTQSKGSPPAPPPKPWLNNARPLPWSVTNPPMTSAAPVDASQPPGPVAPSRNPRSSSIEAQSTVWATPPPAGSSGTVQPISENIQRKLVSDLINFFDQHSNQK